MIHNQEQFRKFISILAPLKEDEVYFVSLSCRNKYMTDEEREFYALGRTEMFGRTLIKNLNDVDFYMNKLYSNLVYKTTKNGKSIPEKGLVTYININPSSMLLAYNMFQQETNRKVFEYVQSTLNEKTKNLAAFGNLDREFLNCVQKSRSRKAFIDIDFDTKSYTLVDRFKSALNKYGVKYYVICTHGGYHVVIAKDTLPSNANLHTAVFDLNAEAKLEGGEVIFNKNQMVPVPGTMQSDFLVTME